GLEGPPFACSQALARCRLHRLDRELGEVDGRSGWRPATAPRCAARPPVRVPDVRAAPCNLVHRAPALDQRVDVGGDVVAASRRVVAMLDQQPLRFRAAVRAYECKGAAETLTLEGDVELPLLEPATNDRLVIGSIGLVREVRAAVPQHDRAAAVLVLGDGALE